ncbi:ABC transporter permease [Streptococcus pacificus]|uniref:Putative hemin transport system permease protein HrtB n=1 Tax=Streptococcus pacificus TaxID=2740577 RepID=A0ABS0ZI49_9STRE|nr:ABC transporter permease [Streptococcus pacificus]MBJ8325674.1 ABC transporter permease [Streptococcus pacificus]
MFLALEEIKQNKLRYSLILGLLFLISYLVFFLSALAYGLIQENKSAVDKWDAKSILLSSDANQNLAASRFDAKTIEDVEGQNLALLAQKSTVGWSKENPSQDDKVKLSLFGVKPNEFLVPAISKGREFNAPDEVVVDISLAEDGDYQIGDEIKLADTDEKLTIVGYTSGSRFSVAPVVYVDFDQFQQIVYGDTLPDDTAYTNAIVSKDGIDSYDSNTLEKLSIPDFIENLPGYKAQNLTFGFMIGFLIIISSIVIGIFMYVLTTQKIQIFGLMKIQGLSNFYISKSVLAQTFLLSFLGTFLGFIGTFLSSLLLPSSVPFENNWLFYGVIALAMVLFAVVGAIFSVRSVIKIDPLKMLG